MRIDALELFRVPLANAQSDSGGPVESVLVRLQSGQHVGWGEACLAAAPTEREEWSAGAFACLRDWLAPAVAGCAIDSGVALQQALTRFRGNHAAKAALDIAWWSLEAEWRGKPLFEVLDGRRATLPLSATLGVMPSTDALFAALADRLARFELVTLKFRPGWDVEMLRAVRQAFAAQPLAIDCDGLCTLGQQEMFYRLEDFFLLSIEQPFAADDLVGHAMLQENLRTPIALDQSITSLARVEQALDLGSCRLVRIDLSRVGGITPALDIVRACNAAKVSCAIGGGPQGGVAGMSAAAVATLCGAPLPEEAFAWSAQPWLAGDSINWFATGAAGKLEIRLPRDAAGLGVSPDASQLSAAAAEHAVVR